MSEETHTHYENFTNTPNLLTMTRIGFVPIIVGLLFLKTPTWDLTAAILFGLVSLTDYFDGYVARSQKLVTLYGKLMDPLADKFLVVSALIMLEHLQRVHPIIVILLICRELAITGLRALASAEGMIISASQGGKWKAVSQYFAIAFLMVKDGLFGIPLFEIGTGLIYFSLILSLWSAKDYGVGFFMALKIKGRKARLERKLRKLRKKAERQGLGFPPVDPPSEH